jgi:hypothetical protein
VLSLRPIQTAAPTGKMMRLKNNLTTTRHLIEKWKV